jgi:hypothetical protein
MTKLVLASFALGALFASAPARADYAAQKYGAPQVSRVMPTGVGRNSYTAQLELGRLNKKGQRTDKIVVLYTDRENYFGGAPEIKAFTATQAWDALHDNQYGFPSTLSRSSMIGLKLVGPGEYLGTYKQKLTGPTDIFKTQRIVNVQNAFALPNAGARSTWKWDSNEGRNYVTYPSQNITFVRVKQ